MKLDELVHQVGARPGFVEHRLATLPASEPRPWYVASAVAVTIWVGAIALGSFLLAIDVFRSAPAQAVGGLTMLALGAVFSRATSGLARLHVSLIAYAGATSLLFVFLDRGQLAGKTATMIGVAVVQVLCFAMIAARPVRFKATFGAVLALWALVLDQRVFFTVDVLIVAVASCLALLWLNEAALSASRFGRAVRPAGFALAASLLWLSAFTLTNWAEARPAAPLLTAALLAVMLIGVVVVAARESGASLASGAVRLALIGVIGVAALAAQSPAVLTAALVIALGRLRREPVLEGLGLLGLVGFAVWLYYGLHVSLLWTSGALVAAGVALIAARAWLLRGDKPAAVPADASVLSPQPRALRRERRALLVVPALLVVAVLLGLVAQKERVVREGRTVLLELAPRDPRSFLQGDYVALSYAASNDLLNTVGWDEHRDRIAVFAIDSDQVARFVRLDDGSAIAKDELRVRALRKRSGFAFGADSYFFSEGRGGEWERARFAELKVGADGTSVLVGLRDEERAQMR